MMILKKIAGIFMIPLFLIGLVAETGTLCFIACGKMGGESCSEEIVCIRKVSGCQYEVCKKEMVCEDEDICPTGGYLMNGVSQGQILCQVCNIFSTQKYLAIILEDRQNVFDLKNNWVTFADDGHENDAYENILDFSRPPGIHNSITTSILRI